MDKQALLQRWQGLTTTLAEADVALLAVSKYAPDEAVQILIDAGQMDFGESRPQNLRDRARKWPACNWHMIGPVQKNKAKYIGRSASAWHSCENLQTARAVARYVEDGSRLPVFIQVNIANIEQQQGVRADALVEFVTEFLHIKGLVLAGLMCMAPRGGDANDGDANHGDANHGDVGEAFARLRHWRDRLLHEKVVDAEKLQLCIGMSEDYLIAMQQGSNMVRLGSTLFGGWDVRG